MSIIDSRSGQIKKTPSRICAQTAATTVDIPEDWDPNTKKEPTWLFFLPPAGGRVPSIPRSGCIKKLLNPKIEELFYDPYGNRTHVTAVKGPCLNRLTNGPKRYRILLKQQATYQSRLQPAPKNFSETLY